MTMNRTIWAGIGVCGVAWLFLLWSIFAPGPLLWLLGQSGPALGQHYLVTLFQCALFTGFVVVLTGALQAGFGALDRFFETILRRSAKSEAPAQQVRKPIAESKGGKVTAAPGAFAVKPSGQINPRAMDEGFLRGRTYVLYSDGSVDVDTLLGRKRFDTMEAAVAYLGVDGNLLRKAA